MDFKGTQGKWHWVEYGSNQLPELMNDNHETVCNFGNDYDYYPTEGIPPNEYDKLLISKAPELLKLLTKLLIDIDWSYETWQHQQGEILRDLILKLIKESTELK